MQAVISEDRFNHRSHTVCVTFVMTFDVSSAIKTAITAYSTSAAVFMFGILHQRALVVNTFYAQNPNLA